GQPAFQSLLTTAQLPDPASIFTSSKSHPFQPPQLNADTKPDLVHRRISLRNSAHPAARTGDGKTPYAGRIATDQRRNGRSSKKIGYGRLKICGRFIDAPNSLAWQLVARGCLEPPQIALIHKESELVQVPLLSS